MQEPQETQVQFLGREDPLETEMAAHSIILAGITPWTEEPGGLQSMGLQRCRHNWVTEHIHVGYQGLGKVEAYFCNPSFSVKKEGAQAQNERKKKKHMKTRAIGFCSLLDVVLSALYLTPVSFSTNSPYRPKQRSFPNSLPKWKAIYKSLNTLLT